jgi:alcohol dehydrogenase YqhD (iron-dependent ADH family)
MKFEYGNTVRVAFGANSIADNFGKAIPPGSSLFVITDDESSQSNSSLNDFILVAKQHSCKMHIEKNAASEPKLEYMKKITLIAKQKVTKYLIGIGGDWILDAAKFLSAAAKLDSATISFPYFLPISMIRVKFPFC